MLIDVTLTALHLLGFPLASHLHKDALVEPAIVAARRTKGESTKHSAVASGTQPSPPAETEHTKAYHLDPFSIDGLKNKLCLWEAVHLFHASHDIQMTL